MAVSANRLELLQIADAVAREKAIDRGIVIAAMEDAIAKAARSRYGAETDVHAEIEPKTGDLRLTRHMLVVEAVENPSNQITLEGARKHHPAAQVGDTIADPLPPLEYGRIAAQSAKQVIVQKVREAERDRQYAEYKDRIGDIVNGIVKRVEYGNVVVDLGRGEAIVRRDEMLPREVFRNGDRIRAYIYDVRREPRGPQIFLSRTHPQFTAKLFAQEVPEIYDGIVEVKAVARDPGSRAKIAVISRDSSVDPVGACVGMRGSRVQAVVNELQGEKIDIIPWSPDIATFVVNALAPAEVAKVVLDEDKERIEVVVPDQQLSLAIGRRGQNVRLASQLTGWDIDILTEQEESERRHAEFENRTKIFVEALNLDEVVGQLLASEGFGSIEELALVDEKEIAGIEGFDEETAQRTAGARQGISRQAGSRTRRQAHRARRRGRGQGSARRHHQDAGRSRRERREDRRRSRRLRHRRPHRLDRAQGRRVQARARLLRRPRRLARGRRSLDHAGPRQGRLGDRGRARAAARSGSRTGAGRRSAAARRKGARQRRCWRWRKTDELDHGATKRRSGDGAALRAHPHAQAGRRHDPLRGRPRRRSGARPQAQAARPRHLDHRHAAPRSTTRSSATCLPAASSATCGSPPICRRRPSACWSRARSMRWRSPARPGRSSAALPRWKRRLAATTSRP